MARVLVCLDLSGAAHRGDGALSHLLAM